MLVACAVATSHAKAGVPGAEALMQHLEPILVQLSSAPAASAGASNPKTDAQLTLVRFGHATQIPNALMCMCAKRTCTQPKYQIHLHAPQSATEPLGLCL